MLGQFYGKVLLWGLAAMALVVIGAGAANAEPLLAGASETVVSPPEGAFIAGDAQNRRFAGTHDDLYAKAVVLRRGDGAVAVVTVDCIGLLGADIQSMRARASAGVKDVQLPPERVIVTSTHTHSGPDVVGIWGPDETTSGKDAAYMERLIAQVAEQVRAASARLKPVTLRYGSGEAGHAWVENICEPALLDRTLTAVALVDTGGETVATLTNFACHPTIMDNQSDLVSSDYVAGYYAGMSEALPGVHVFLQGAIGGWVQPKKTVRTFEAAESRGRGLAAVALKALAEGKTASETDMAFARKRFSVPLENPKFQALAQMGVLAAGQDGQIETEVAWVKIGPLQFATHPGETSPAHGLETRALMSGEAEMVLGLGLDALGYILTPPYYTDAGMKYAEYLTSMSVGPRIGPAMMESLRAIIPRG